MLANIDRSVTTAWLRPRRGKILALGERLDTQEAVCRVLLDGLDDEFPPAQLLSWVLRIAGQRLIQFVSGTRTRIELSTRTIRRENLSLPTLCMAW